MKTSGKVLALYMTLPDLMRSGHRIVCEEFDCDPDGIIGDNNYETSEEHVMLLTCQSSYDIANSADIAIDQGILLENIHIDIDIYELKKGSIIEIGENLLEVTGSCEVFGYLASLAPELTELLKGKRGLFVRPLEYGKVAINDNVTVVKEV
jgi:MOSC domain-containing protein YiiM